MTAAFVYRETKCQNKYKNKTSYGSQRPVVEFVTARGQYAPNGQAVVRWDRRNSGHFTSLCLIMLQMLSHNKYSHVDGCCRKNSRSMQVRPRGQKKPSQHGWQLVFLSGTVSLSLLLGTGFEPTEHPQPGSQPGAQADRPQFMFVFRKRFFSPFASYRLVK